MLGKKSLKVTAAALALMFGIGATGFTASSVEAASRDNHPGYSRDSGRHYDRDRRDHRDDRHYDRENRHRHSSRSSSKTRSQGDVNTAAIVGAIIGAVIAKNT